MSDDVYSGLINRDELYIMETLITPSASDILPDLVDVHESFHRAGEAQQSIPIRVGVTMDEAQSTIEVREGMGIPTRHQGFGQNM